MLRSGALGKSILICVLCLVVWPSVGLLPLPESFALLQALIAALILPIVLPLILVRRQGAVLSCIAIFSSLFLMMAFVQWDFLGCGAIDAQVAKGVCFEDEGLRQIPSLLAAFVLLILLASQGAKRTFQRLSRRIAGRLQ